MKYTGRSFTYAVSDSKEGRANFELIDWRDDGTQREEEVKEECEQNCRCSRD